MTNRDMPFRRGWFLLQPDGWFDWDDPQYGEPPDGSWIATGRSGDELVALVGFPPDEPPVGDNCESRYPRRVLTGRGEWPQGRDARASASGRRQ